MEWFVERLLTFCVQVVRAGHGGLRTEEKIRRLEIIKTRGKNMITQWCSDRNCSNEYLVLQNHKRSCGALQEVPKAIRRINSWLCVRGRLTLPHQWHKFKTPRSPRSHEGAKPTSPKSWNPNTHVLHAYTNGPKQTRTHLKNCATGLTSDLVF
jgi:hypothetical protein